MPARIHRGVVVVTVVASVCTVACAAILGFDDPSHEAPDGGGGNEAGGNEDAGKDAVVDAGPCNLNNEFDFPAPVPGISDLGWSSVRAATLSADEKRIYFQAAPKEEDDGNIYMASRRSLDERFDNPIALGSAVNTDGQDFNPTISADETRLVFVRQTGDSGSVTDLFFTSREHRDAGFLPAQALNLVNSSTASDVSPFLTPDGTQLWFTSNRPDGGSLFRIHHARASGSSYIDATPIDSPDGRSVRNGSPVLSVDGEVLFYAAPRTGSPLDGVWEARRDTSGNYTARRQVSEINTEAYSDAPTWLSPDGCRLYVHSLVGKRGQMSFATRKR